MAPKYIIFVLLITLTSIVHGKEVSNIHRSNEISRSEKEGRTLIEVPIIAGLYLLFKVAGVLVSSVVSLVQFKLAAVSSVLDLAAWVYQNYFAVIVGTAVVVGFCVMTSSLYSEPVVEFDPRLVQAARNLDQGIVKYGKLI